MGKVVSQSVSQPATVFLRKMRNFSLVVVYGLSYIHSLFGNAFGVLMYEMLTGQVPFADVEMHKLAQPTQPVLQHQHLFSTTHNVEYDRGTDGPAVGVVAGLVDQLRTTD
jgi:hypothetical protein